MRQQVRVNLLLIFVTVFTSMAAYSQTFSVLYNFGNINGDPIQPSNPGMIAQGRDGNLYSTAPSGGASACGAVFKMTLTGTLSVLYNLDGTHGCIPMGGLTLGTDGNFYGTTLQGGSPCCSGTIFKVTPTGNLTTLYSFTGQNDGCYPFSAPTQGTDGNWYGTTSNCGTYSQGTVYRVTSTGTFTALYQFDGGAHGGQPQDPVTQGTDGNLYGTTLYGGSLGYGIVFKISTAGKLTVLYNFDGAHGGFPTGPLIQGKDANFYGTTQGNGSDGGGVVFKITTSGNLTVLHNMSPNTDGAGPADGVIQASDSNLYGANSLPVAAVNEGTIFKTTTAGAFSIVYPFDTSGTNGSAPQANLVQHTNGILYGDTQAGGTGNVVCAAGSCGVFYSLNKSLPPFAGLVSTSGRVGAKIGILGQGFTSSSVVTFGTVAASTITRSGTTFLTATVPSGATTGLVTVTTNSGTLTSIKTFRVAPQITTFAPASGPDGTSVTITGVSLTQTTKVTFGGVASTKVTVNSDGSVTATVPSGARSGKIVITTKGGAVTSSGSFTVQPSISSFTPTSGAPGTAVTITGGGFTGTTAVTFNGVAATYTVNSDSKITTSVPSSATTGPISVTTAGGKATSSTNFTVN